jgi:hypothetical protein
MRKFHQVFAEILIFKEKCDFFLVGGSSKQASLLSFGDFKVAVLFCLDKYRYIANPKQP